MEIEISSTESAIAADAKRSEASTEEVEQQESVDSKESETAEESEASENAESSEEEQDAEESSDSDEAKEEKEDEKSELPKGLKKRLGRLTKQREQAKQEAEYWKREALKRQESNKSEEVEQKTKANVVSSDKPKAEDFETHEDFVEALTDWKLEQREKAREEKNREVQAKSAIEKQVEAHNERVQKFKETASDYDEVISDFIEEHGQDGDFRFSPALTAIVYESDLGPQAIYELAKNPSELLRINSLGPLAAAREFGKLEAKLSKQSSTQTQTKQTTKAPPPPNVLNGKSDKAVKKSIYDPGLPFEEYERLRAEELKQKGY